MSAQLLEAFLARLYTDARLRERFRADPRGEAARAGLHPEQCRSLEQIDWPGLEAAAASFEKKRRRKQPRG